MRIALIGVSHWHTPFYLDPLLTMPDMTVIAVSDPDVARAEEVAARLAARPSTTTAKCARG
jgi:predicted dehydrogenase